jgi:hypothetical protein
MENNIEFTPFGMHKIDNQKHFSNNNKKLLKDILTKFEKKTSKSKSGGKN